MKSLTSVQASRVRTRVLSMLWIVAACAAFDRTPIHAQTSSTLRILVLADSVPVEGVSVSAATVRALTGADGLATLRLAAGAHRVRVERIGYATRDVDISVRANADTTITITLEEEAIESESIIISSTRAERRIEDEPMRVEVIGREEIEEKLLMTPGDIGMMLNETAGLRVQPTAPSLGGASVRIQGLRGRYTQILSDGLPLYGGQTGALGPLQIPPMDLRQVEIIKGAASALYGASALGGVVNLLSRLPDETPENEILLNQSTLGGTDAILWRSAPVNEQWGYTLLGSAHRQARADVDDDGWADLPGYRRVVLRPRAFWSNASGGTAFITVGAMLEDREGGTMPGRSTTVGTFREGLETGRFDAGIVRRWSRDGGMLITLRGSGTAQTHEHDFAGVPERDQHTTGFAEASLAGNAGRHVYVAGAAVQHDDYDADDVPAMSYQHTVPGVFLQDEYAAASWLTLSGSGRLDFHSEYGTFLNPRVSALFRPDGQWTVRASGGTGYFAPTPWTDETEAVGLHRLVTPADMVAERARNLSLDIGRTLGPIELNATLFASRIDNAVQVRPAGTDGMIEMFNAAESVRTHGSELLARYHAEGVHVTATHVYTRSTEPAPDGGGRRDVPLTPRHTAALVAALEQEGRGRVAVELYYTGVQKLEDNPYRDESPASIITGFLVERHFGRVRAFLNAENIFDTRQTRHDPLVLPARAPDGRLTTDVWAPLEGRSFNAGIRWQF